MEGGYALKRVGTNRATLLSCEHLCETINLFGQSIGKIDDRLLSSANRDLGPCGEYSSRSPHGAVNVILVGNRGRWVELES